MVLLSTMVVMMIVLIMTMVVVMMMVMMVLETWPLSLSSLQLPSLRLVIKENIRLYLSFVRSLTLME